MNFDPSLTRVRSTVARRCAALAAAAVLCLSATALLEAAPAKEDLAALVNQMPQVGADGKYTGPDPADAEKVYVEVLKGGKDAVLGLIALVPEPGKGEEYKVKYLLHGLATYVARPDAEKDRLMFCDALASTLAGPTPKAVKAFVLQELGYVGSVESVTAIAKVLLDDELCDPAARTLLAIGGTADIFRKALPAAKGRNRLTVIQALGVLRDAQAVADLKKAAADEDRDTRVSARDALANIGDAGATDTLLAGIEAAKEPVERFKAVDASLVLAKRLLEAGNKKDPERIYRTLWDKCAAAEDRHIRCAALQGLAAVRGDMNDILAAMKTNDPQIRVVAMRLAASTSGLDATGKCVEAMAKATPADKASLLAILGARGDATAMPAVLAAIKDADAEVRAAAMLAASAIGGPEAAQTLIGLVGSTTGRDRDAAADALAKMRGKEAGAVVAAAVKTAGDADVRATLLRVLAARRMTDQMDVVLAALADNQRTVRIAALQALALLAGEGQLPAVIKVIKETKDNGERAAAEEALVAACSRQMADPCANLVAAAMAGAPPEGSAAMLRVLGAAGNRKAMDTIMACTKDPNAEVRDVAVRVLADWRTKDAAPALTQIALTSDNPTHKVLALRGAVRLASAKGVAADERIKILGDIMEAARRPEEKREVLAGLSGMQTVDALKLAVGCLDDDAVKEEAAAAVVQIADRLAKKNPDAVRDAVTKALQATKNEGVKANAERILKQVKKP